jgi:hypothetical protein
MLFLNFGAVFFAPLQKPPERFPTFKNALISENGLVRSGLQHQRAGFPAACCIELTPKSVTYALSGNPEMTRLSARDMRDDS